MTDEEALYFDRSLGCELPFLEFDYVNYKGEASRRKVEGLPHLWYGTTEYHQDPQWLMTAFDVNKQALRDFALRDIKFLSE